MLSSIQADRGDGEELRIAMFPNDSVMHDVCQCQPRKQPTAKASPVWNDVNYVCLTLLSCADAGEDQRSM